MPIVGNIVAPASASLLELSGSQIFIAFMSSKDPITKEAWCPDVRVVLPLLNAAFAPADAPELAFIEVGQRPEWKAPNVYRANWKIDNVPTLVKFENVDGEVKETARLDEDGIKTEKSLYSFISK